MRLALGPVLYFWPAQKLREFYAQAAGWPVDIVYLGEIVCAKRRSFRVEDWLAVADQLSAAGKEVVLSTQVLLEAESELGVLARLCRNARYPVEVNDMAALNLLDQGRPFVAGPHINSYNAETLALLAERGASRWVLPVELSGDTLAKLQAERPAGLATEVFAFGRLPLAFSARCFTARAHNVPKDQCELRCGAYPGGAPMYTQEDQHLFTVNGIQLQSAMPTNLLAAVGRLAELGVDVLRISPEPEGTELVVEAFRGLVDGRLDRARAEEMIAALSGEGWCNGYWHGEPGMDWRALMP